MQVTSSQALPAWDKGALRVLPANICQVWKRLVVRNTLACKSAVLITTMEQLKSSIVQALGVC